MRIAIASCVKYSDAWEPFLKLWQRFWPTCSYETLFITDEKRPGQSWCAVVAEFASKQKQPILLLQEDFWLSAPVREDLVEHALRELQRNQAAMIRLYPCPGADEEYGDSHYGRISRDADYRVSCQASIWQPHILHEIASHFNTPSEFEIAGTKLSREFSEPFLAFKREKQPWPMEYICSAISRGQWEPGALEFCQKMNIRVDTSRREIRAC